MESETLKKPGRADDRNVWTAVAVEFADCKEIGESRGKVLPWLECSIPIAQQHRD
jgi:hypothetical protein